LYKSIFQAFISIPTSILIELSIKCPRPGPLGPPSFAKIGDEMRNQDEKTQYTEQIQGTKLSFLDQTGFHRSFIPSLGFTFDSYYEWWSIYIRSKYINIYFKIKGKMFDYYNTRLTSTHVIKIINEFQRFHVKNFFF
jgi:hypothetical protein